MQLDSVQIMKHDANYTKRTPERDEAIWRAVISGKTLQAVGEQFGLSRERIRQLYVILQRRRGLSRSVVKGRIAALKDEL